MGIEFESLTCTLCCRRVQNLFHSVQLNVNNPHFLIMQGRITKVIRLARAAAACLPLVDRDPRKAYEQVLNMKPPEILGMLEEAAGTRMYESKKENALKTLERKQIKVDEINKVCCSAGGQAGACSSAHAHICTHTLSSLQVSRNLTTCTTDRWAQVLNEDILPALKRLKREKGTYLQYQTAEQTLDRLTRFVAAHRYVTAQQ